MGKRMGKSVADIRRENEIIYGTKDNTFDDFPIAIRVKVVCPCEDFTFFNGETGVVTQNTGDYLGIAVKFDNPPHYRDGSVLTGFSFNPKSLCVLNKITEEIAETVREQIGLDEFQKEQSARFIIMDFDE